MLANILRELPTWHDDRLLVGYDTSDDASVFKLRDDLAIVQSVDFFPPIVDDPYLFGQIAAANALSDLYAMGCTPTLAMNVMTVNLKMGEEAIRDILRGGYDKAYEAQCIVSGGHTIEDKEPKYGMAVTGFIHPDKLLRNDGAQPGDILILTKPLGIGLLTTGAQGDMVDQPVLDRIYAQMATLNKTAYEHMVRYTVHGCTDVTGFGLMGHAYEMAKGSGVTIHLLADDVPFHKEALPLAEMGFIPAGTYRNRAYVGGAAAMPAAIQSKPLEDVLYDPQTSGGLLIALSAEEGMKLADELEGVLPGTAIVGYVTEKEEKDIVVKSSYSAQ